MTHEALVEALRSVEGLVDVSGERTRFSGRLCTQGVCGWAGLWMRVDGPDATHRSLAFYNNEDRGLTGSTDWAMQDAVLDVAPEATVVLIGAILSGRGELYLAGLDVPIVDEMTPVNRAVLASVRSSPGEQVVRTA